MGAIYRSVDCGKSWTEMTPTEDPSNSWSDSPAPTVADVSFIQRVDSVHANGWHVFLATWANGDGDWRSWLLKTVNDGTSYSWTALAPFTLDDDGWIWPLSLSGYGGHVVAGTQSNAIGAPNGSYVTFTGSGAVGYVQYEYGVAFNGPGAIRTRSVARNDGETIECRVVPGGGLGDINSYHWYLHGTDPVGSVYDVTRSKAYGSAATWAQFSHGNTPTQSAGYIDSIGIYAADLYAASFAGLKALWADVDSADGSVLWLTAWKSDETLVLQKRSTTDLSLTAEYSLGSCTEAELNAYTYWAAPNTVPFSTGVYVYGRMQDPQSLGDPAHLIYSSDGGSSWSLVEGGLGADYISSFRCEGISDPRSLYAIKSGSGVAQLYTGSTSLSYKSDLLFPAGAAVLPDALSIATSAGAPDGRIAAGSSVANVYFVITSNDDGATWNNASANLDTSQGTIRTVVWV